MFGVYIRMFAAVAVNILKCMFTYLGLLFAFSLTLHFLFRQQKEFDSVGFTFLKVRKWHAYRIDEHPMYFISVNFS